MDQRLITDQAQFEDLCEHVRVAGIAAFDTEFVSEYTYRPELCLLQVATAERTVAIDPFEVPNLDSWWKLMADDETTIVVHGGREEVRFCTVRTGQQPRRLVDIQIAEGLRSRSYPLAYSALVGRVLGKKVHGKEARTDWRLRPLSKRQIDYSLEDVAYVLEIWRRQRESLTALGRLEWAEAEFQRMVGEVDQERSRDNWRRLSGIHRLNPREMAVARELYFWREAESTRTNQPLRRILRDDLLLELARRQPQTTKDLLATRDMNRSNYRRSAEELLHCIATGRDVPHADLPTKKLVSSDEKNQDEQVIGKLLGIALANRCAELDVSMSLVGTSADLRHLVRWHVYGEQDGPPPRLTEGWRAVVCGDLLTDVLDGKIALRVADPESDHPLIFERWASPSP